MGRSVVDVGGAYGVHLGAGVLEELRGHLRPGRRVLVVHQPGREALLAEVLAVVRSAGGHGHPVEVPDAEAAKDVAVLTGLWHELGRAGFGRDDLVVGLGGGAVTDLAGFAAATWLRGVDVVHLPTSLLGVVDAAVGGKTGINTAEGKNLVGAFHPPVAVLCDPAWLVSMPRADYVSGLAEAIKCGLVADPVILELVERRRDEVLDPCSAAALEVITRAVQVKADVVSADLRESSVREILNYGHTLAHAIEQVEGYTWRHGDAVAVGLVYAAELAVLAGPLSPAVRDRHRSVLASVGLPTAYRAGQWAGLRAAMGRDKKARAGALRFVVLEDLARPTRLVEPSEALLEAAYAAISGPSASSAPSRPEGHQT